MVEAHPVLEVADRVLDLGVAAVVGLEREGLAVAVGDEGVLVVQRQERELAASLNEVAEQKRRLAERETKITEQTAALDASVSAGHAAVGFSLSDAQSIDQRALARCGRD